MNRGSIHIFQLGLKPLLWYPAFLLLQPLLLSTWPRQPVEADTQSTAPAFLCLGVQNPLAPCVALAMWICMNQCHGNRDDNWNWSVNNCWDKCLSLRWGSAPGHSLLPETSWLCWGRHCPGWNTRSWIFLHIYGKLLLYELATLLSILFCCCLY